LRYFSRILALLDTQLTEGTGVVGKSELFAQILVNELTAEVDFGALNLPICTTK